MKGGYVNTGNITVTGGTGAVGDKSFNLALGGIAGTFYSGIENAINTGNITVTGDSGVDISAIGGIVGYNKAQQEIKNCQSYCTIKAFVKSGETITPYKNVGMITGSVRAALGTNLARVAAVRNCKVGGKLIWLSEDRADEETGENTLIEEPGDLDASNWFKYIYSAEVTEAVAEGDGCERLATKPSVPVYTPAN